MDNKKYIKLKCKKNNKYFLAELKPINGVYRVINFVDLNDEDAKHIGSELPGLNYESNNNLLPATYNSTRKICSVNSTNINRFCSKSS